MVTPARTAARSRFVVVLFALAAGLAVLVPAEAQQPRAFASGGVSHHVGGVAFHSATLLADGRVFIAGGRNETGTFFHGEIYDPASETFAFAAERDVRPRSQHSATLLADGRVLLVGGRGIDRTVTATASVFDVTTGRWRAVGSMATPRFDHTATLLRDGRVLIAGGEDERGGDHELSSAELFDPATNTFSAAAGARPGAPTLGMTRARSAHTATLLDDGRVLIAGGSSVGFEGLGGLASAELYDPVRHTFTRTGTLRRPRFGHTATLLGDGRVLIAGGANSFFGALASAELYDPASGRFTRTGDMSAPRIGQSATLLPNGLVLIAGGQDGPTDAATRYADAELYDPATGSFSPAGEMMGARAFHTATALPDGGVLLFGGRSGQSIHLTELASAERYEPLAPVFNAFQPSADGTAAVLRWSAPTAAAAFQLCAAASPDRVASSCVDAPGPTGEVSWDVEIDAPGAPDANRRFDSGWRYTALRGCAAAQCSRLVAGPAAGGLRWQAWSIDFDYFAMVLRLPSGREITIAGVINLSQRPRGFVLTNGPPDDPLRRTIVRCGAVAPGASCSGFIGPFGGPQGAVVAITSAWPGTPTTEHDIPVR